MSEKTLVKYPSAARIRRAIQAVTKSGIAIASVELSPSGDLRIVAATATLAPAANDFDEWDRQGLL